MSLGTYYNRGENPKIGDFVAYDHVRFIVRNAKQAAYWYCANYWYNQLVQLTNFAYRGLENGSRHVAQHVIKHNKIVLVFENALLPNNQEPGVHLIKHGDAVKDVCFEVEDLDSIMEHARKNGAEVVREITEEGDDDGSIRYATIKTYGEMVHTLLERKNYKGLFLPGFTKHPMSPDFFRSLPPVRLYVIDHCVGNQPVGKMEDAVQWYERTLAFHRFWSVDDKLVHTEYSALTSIVVASYNEKIKMPVNEPATGKLADSGKPLS